LPLSEQVQTHCHNGQSRDQPADGHIMLALLFRRGKKFVQKDIDHYTSNSGEDQSEGCIIEDGSENEIAEKGADSFGDPRQEREPERFSAAFRRIMDGDGNGDSLGKVMDANGKPGEKGQPQGKPGITRFLFFPNFRFHTILIQ